MKKKFLSVLAAFAVLVSFSACQAGDTGQQVELIDSVVSESTTVEETTVSLANAEKSGEVLLPDGWTMDELRNILIINGQTLTLPTTLNKIMELDEKFSYEAEYVDKSNDLYQGENGFYIDVLYAGESMFMTVFASDENNIKNVLDDNLYNVSFSCKSCEKANINISTSCGLDFTSSYNDIIEVLGEPNTYNFQDAIKTYEFYDENYEFCIEFSINENNLISRIRVKSVNINGGNINE